MRGRVTDGSLLVVGREEGHWTSYVTEIFVVGDGKLVSSVPLTLNPWRGFFKGSGDCWPSSFMAEAVLFCDNVGRVFIDIVYGGYIGCYTKDTGMFFLSHVRRILVVIY